MKSSRTVLLVEPLLRKKYPGLLDDFGKAFDMPYGLLAIASYLEKKGIESKIVSMDFETGRQSDEDVLAWHLEKEKPEIVGFTSYTLQFNDALRLAGIVRQQSPKTKIVIGGHHAMHQAGDVLGTGLFDAVVIGEGEKVFYDFVSAGKVNPEGTATLENLDTVTKARRLEGSEIATPNYKLLPHQLVENANPIILTSRGCTFDCSFCSSKAQYGRVVKARELSSVREELAALVKYGHKRIGILDETLHARSDFNELVAVLKQLHYETGASYLCQTRADAVVKKPESLAIMKESGVYSLIIGAESASEQVLKAMNKQLSYSDVPAALRLIKQAGISPGTFWIVGHPGSSYEEEMKTKRALEELVKENLSDYIEVNLFMPYPGTESRHDIRIIKIDQDCARFNRAGEPVHDLIGFPREIIARAYREIISVALK